MAAGSAVRLGYGPHPRQFVDLWDGLAPTGTVLLVHGGFWREEKDSESLLDAVRAAAAFSARVGSVEYRPASSGGAWPGCRDDIVAACLTVLAWERYCEPLVLVGHSAGGHLALLAAPRLPESASVVALAPITDLAAAMTQGLGEHAVEGLLALPHGSPVESVPDQASPVLQPPPACRVVLLHGTADQAVPYQQSQALARAWPGTGYIPVPGARHMHLVKPERPGWSEVAAAVAAEVRRAEPA